MRVAVFDAMGVLEQTADDVGGLLRPFVAGKGVTIDDESLWRLYRDASLGRMSSSELWTKLGLSLECEAQYIAIHRLTQGMKEVLKTLHENGFVLWCLSNDVAEWAEKRLVHFGIRHYFHGLTISGMANARKPEKRIYRIMLEEAKMQPKDIVFVDDRKMNLDTAAALGMKTVLFTGNTNTRECGSHVLASSSQELLSKVLKLSTTSAGG